ncbi:MAG: 50S ribosomal protein L1 [Ignavibacteriaceae bacterium]|nr:50S ribosomal protein L1 [Ignavibacteriaceae bacterium]
MKQSKRFAEISKKIDKNKEYKVEEAIDLLKAISTVKFVESVDCALRLGVDPRHADQMVRGTAILPHGLGKEIKVLVVAKGEKIQEALDAGADYAGFEDYLEKIQAGWADCDVIIATPDVMAQLGKLGKILGPKGLMPNPKSGTVTTDVAKAVQESKAGKIDFRVDKQSNLITAIGKLNFETDQLSENLRAFMSAVIKLKPATAKGHYIKSMSLSTTMGPGLKIAKDEFAS